MNILSILAQKKSLSQNSVIVVWLLVLFLTLNFDNIESVMINFDKVKCLQLVHFILTFTTPWANSADNKLVMFFLLFLEKTRRQVA